MVDPAVGWPRSVPMPCVSGVSRAWPEDITTNTAQNHEEEWGDDGVCSVPLFKPRTQRLEPKFTGQNILPTLWQRTKPKAPQHHSHSLGHAEAIEQSPARLLRCDPPLVAATLSESPLPDRVAHTAKKALRTLEKDTPRHKGTVQGMVHYAPSPHPGERRHGTATQSSRRAPARHSRTAAAVVRHLRGEH